MQKSVALLAIIGLLLLIATCAALIGGWSMPNPDSEWSPVWSSDQQYVAFECMFLKLSDWVNYDEGSYLYLRDICILNRNNNEVRRLTRERGMYHPAWSPNGLMLAWLKGGDTITIWDASTNRFKNVQYSRPFNGSEDEDGPQWSRDGRKIFMQGDGAILDVQRMTFTDPVGSQRSLDTCCFNWSPNGSYLAYMRVTHQDSSGNHWQLVIIKNNEAIYINEAETDLFEPVQWSPDSSILTWIGEIPSNTGPSHYQLAFTNVATNQTKTLTFGNGFIGISGIAWSPSGNQIAVRQDDQLHIVNLTSVGPAIPDFAIQRENITLRGSSFAGISWSPNGKFIAYETDWQDNSRIWILEPSSNAQIPLVARFGD